MTMPIRYVDKEGNVFLDGKKVRKMWESFSGWYWYGVENLGKGRWFGYVQGLEDEWGYFDENELRSLPNKIWEVRKYDMASAGKTERFREFRMKSDLRKVI